MEDQVITTTTTSTTGAVQPVPPTHVEQTTITTTTEAVPTVPTPESVNVNVNAAGVEGETLTVDVPAVPGTDATITSGGANVNVNQG